MATNYPSGLDSLSNPAGSDALSTGHASQHANANDAIEAIETELGTEPSGASATVKARFEAIEANDWVTTARIANSQITSAKIADGTVTGTDIAATTITSTNIADGAVTGQAAAPLATALSVVAAVSRDQTDLAAATAAVGTSGRLRRSGDSIAVQWDHGADTLVHYLGLSSSLNGLFGFRVLTQYTGHDPADAWPYPGSGGATVHACGDDVAPVSGYWCYVAGDHGYLTAQWTISGHGKTSADLGSQWSDGTHTLTLAHISGNTLQFMFPVQSYGSGAYGADYSTIAAGTLTHVSGATHTDSLTMAVPSTYGQLLPSVTAATVTTDLADNYDGALVPFTVTETYTVPSYTSLVSTAQGNVGDTLAQWLAAASAGFTVTNVFTIAGPLVQVQTTWTFTEATKVNYIGQIQAQPLTIPSGGSLVYVVPGLADKTGTTYGTGYDVTSAPPSLTFSTAETTTPGLPPHRATMVAKDSSGNPTLGLRVGYSDIDDTSEASRTVNAAAQCFFIHSTRKVYPSLYANATITAGTVLQGTAYRWYMTPDDRGRIDDGRRSINIDGGTP